MPLLESKRDLFPAQLQEKFELSVCQVQAQISGQELIFVSLCFPYPHFRPVLQETPFPHGKEMEEENACVGADWCKGGRAPELGLVLSCVVTEAAWLFLCHVLFSQLLALQAVDDWLRDCVS